MHAFASFPDHRAGVLCRSGGVDGASAGVNVDDVDALGEFYGNVSAARVDGDHVFAGTF